MKQIAKILVLIVVISFFSCKKEKTNWDINGSLPIAEGNLTVANLVGDSLVNTDSSGAVSIVYQQKFYDLTNDSLYKIPDTTITRTLNIPLQLTVSPGQSFYSNNNTSTYNLNQVQLNYASVSSGIGIIKMVSTVQEKTVVDFKVPCFKKNGQPLEIREYIPKPSGSSITITKTFNLNDYDIDFTGPNHNNVNTIYSNVVALVDSAAAAAVTIPAGNVVTIYFTLKSIVPYYVRGYFGHQFIHIGPETVNFDMFKHIKGGQIDLDNAIVDLDLKNGAGIDAKLTLNSLATENTSTNTNVALVDSIIGTPIIISRAQEISGTPPVAYTYNHIHLDKNNSNSQNLLEILPDELKYDLDIEINPLGNVSGGNDFLYKDYPMESNLNIKIPLNLSMSDISLIDTLKVNFDKQKQVANIKSLQLFADITNGFPFTATLSFSFLDSNNNVLFNSAFNGVIDAGSLNTQNKVVAANDSHLALDISEENAKELTKARNVILTAKFNTVPANTKVIFYSNYNMDIDLYGDFVYNVVK